MQNNAKDVVVIGGGVVGTAILRALSFYKLESVLVEKQLDVCEGASKANSGIVHTGFDAKPNTIEAECLRRSRSLWPELVEQLKIPFIPCGAVMVATNDEERATIQNVYIPNAEGNGVSVEWVSKETMLETNPELTDNVVGGLMVPGESVCDPFWATRAFAENAILNGAEVLLGSGVVEIDELRDQSIFRLVLENGREILTRYIVNAAGLWADEVARMIGDDSFTLTPRKGQFILTEEELNVSNIILPVPTKKSKGILVSPIVFGGFLFGPTAEDQEDKWDRSTTQAGMEKILAGCERLVPRVRKYETIRQFAGVRAVCSEGDYVIRPSEQNQRMIHAAGIRSTGVSAAPGIAERVIDQLRETGLKLEPNDAAVSELPQLFDTSEDQTGEIVCLCRSITRGEIMNALKRPLVSLTVDGIKRRTGATLGECQGNYCIPRIIELMEETVGQQAINKVYKGLKGSCLAIKRGEKIE